MLLGVLWLVLFVPLLVNDLGVSPAWFGAIDAGPVTLTDLNVAVPNLSVWRYRSRISLLRRLTPVSSESMIAAICKHHRVPGLVYVGFNALAWLVGSFLILGLAQLGQLIVLRLREHLFGHLTTLSLRYFSEQRAGWIIARVTSDVDAISDALSQGLPTLVSNVVLLPTTVVVLFVVDARRLGRGQGGGPTRGQLLRSHPVGFTSSVGLATGVQPIFQDYNASGGLFPIQ